MNNKAQIFISWPQMAEWLHGIMMLGGGFKYFLFSPLLGEMIQFN